MKKISQVKAGVVLSYAQILAHNIISILFTPIILRILGQNEYGVYQLVASVVAYLGLLSFGFSSSYMRYYSKLKVSNDQDGIAVLNGMFLTIYIMMGILALIIGFILTFNIHIFFSRTLSDEEIRIAKVLMAFMVFNMACSFPASVFTFAITAHEKYIFQKTVNLLNTVISPFVTLPVLLLGYGSIGLIVVTSIMTLIVNAVNLIYAVYKLKMSFTFGVFDWSMMKDISIFSMYIFIGMIVDQINWNVDKFILGAFAGAAAVAVYSIGSQFNSYFLTFSTAISSVFVPRVNRMVFEKNDSKELTNLFIRVGRVQFVVIAYLFVAFTTFGRFFINIWAGAEYDRSFIVAMVLVVSILCPSIQNIGIEIQKAKNLHKFRSITYAAIAICNLVISIPLCIKYGEIGCAIGTSVTMLLGNGIIMNIYYYKIVGVNIVLFWRQILCFIPSLILPILCCIAIGISKCVRSRTSFVIYALIYSIVYFASMFIFGLNKDERQTVLIRFHRL